MFCIPKLDEQLKLNLVERLRNHLRDRASERKNRLKDQTEEDEKYRKWLEQNKQKPTDSPKSEDNERQEENIYQSVYETYNPQATQEDDMEEDLALLDDEDDLC